MPSWVRLIEDCSSQGGIFPLRPAILPTYPFNRNASNRKRSSTKKKELVPAWETQEFKLELSYILAFWLLFFPLLHTSLYLPSDDPLCRIHQGIGTYTCRGSSELCCPKNSRFDHDIPALVPTNVTTRYFRSKNSTVKNLNIFGYKNGSIFFWFSDPGHGNFFVRSWRPLW